MYIYEILEIDGYRYIDKHFTKFILKGGFKFSFKSHL